jgi:hypothetical protein
MKRCPQFSKNYFDESLVFCLDDGARLSNGRLPDGPATAILSGDSLSVEDKTQMP